MSFSFFTIACESLGRSILFFSVKFRAAKEGREDPAGAGEGQEETGRGDVGFPGSDSRAAGPDRGAEGPAGQKGGGAAGDAEQVRGGIHSTQCHASRVSFVFAAK